MNHSDASVIYMRTQKGQALAMAHRALPEECTHMVLRMVNGYTPASVLANLARATIPDVGHRLHYLEARGLIQAVQHPTLSDLARAI